MRSIYNVTGVNYYPHAGAGGGSYKSEEFNEIFSQISHDGPGMVTISYEPA